MPVGVEVLEVAVDGISSASTAGVAVTDGWEGTSVRASRRSASVNSANVCVGADLRCIQAKSENEGVSSEDVDTAASLGGIAVVVGARISVIAVLGGVNASNGRVA